MTHNEQLLVTVGVLRHPCDLDLLLFFHRNPRAILPSERLAAYVGYSLDQVARSIDLLNEIGLLERSQHPMHVARMYVLATPNHWLTTLLELGSTREGRRELLHAMEEASARRPAEAGEQSARHKAAPGAMTAR